MKSNSFEEPEIARNETLKETLSEPTTLGKDFKSYLLSMGIELDNERAADIIPLIDAFLKLREGAKWMVLRRFHLKAIDYTIIDYLCLGKSNKEIASNVQLSEQAIKYHMTKNFKRFGVKNREELRTKLEDLLLGAH